MSDEELSNELPVGGAPKKEMPRTVVMENVDNLFKASAKAAIESAGVEVLNVLSNHPGLPIVELIKFFNRQLNAVGFISAAYEAAENAGVVRDVAFDLLTRTIVEGFPNGWVSNSKIHPVVKLVGWLGSVKNYTKDPKNLTFARRIVEALAIANPPADGWKPEIRSDPLLRKVFDECWPI